MATQGDQQRSKSKTKTIHSLASPFPEPSWPQISSEDQQALLDLLCLLLQDIGHYRKSLPASKGKRSKRKEEKGDSDQSLKESKALPRPEIESSILIGFNDVQRRLESMIRSTTNPSVTSAEGDQNRSKQRSDSDMENLSDFAISSPKTTNKELNNAKKPRLVAVFVDRSSQPPIMTRQLPDMMAAAAVSLGQNPVLWLVALANGAGSRLAEVMGLRRLGFCGVLADAPGSNTLLHYLKSHIPPVQPSVLDAAASAQFLSLKVGSQSIEVEAKSPGKKLRHQHDLAACETESRTSKKRRRTQSKTSFLAS